MHPRQCDNREVIHNMRAFFLVHKNDQGVVGDHVGLRLGTARYDEFTFRMPQGGARVPVQPMNYDCTKACNISKTPQWRMPQGNEFLSSKAGRIRCHCSREWLHLHSMMQSYTLSTSQSVLFYLQHLFRCSQVQCGVLSRKGLSL